MIEEKGENLESKIIGNILEGLTEVKHEGKYMTNNSQDLVDLLKITTTQSIDFVGVKNLILSSTRSHLQKSFSHCEIVVQAIMVVGIAISNIIFSHKFCMKNELVCPHFRKVISLYT